MLIQCWLQNILYLQMSFSQNFWASLKKETEEKRRCFKLRYNLARWHFDPRRLSSKSCCFHCRPTWLFSLSRTRSVGHYTEEEKIHEDGDSKIFPRFDWGPLYLVCLLVLPAFWHWKRENSIAVCEWVGVHAWGTMGRVSDALFLPRIRDLSRPWFAKSISDQSTRSTVEIKEPQISDRSRREKENWPIKALSQGKYWRKKWTRSCFGLMRSFSSLMRDFAVPKIRFPLLSRSFFLYSFEKKSLMPKKWLLVRHSSSV